LQRFQGDGETGLSFKIKEKGLLALYHPGASVTHLIPASRLTPESFERRAFYQGVCDSYTAIRRNRSVPGRPRRSWKDCLRPTKSWLDRKMILRDPSSRGIRVLMARAHIAGVKFHEDEVRSDRNLLDWVLRPHYFDYRLPVGV
jgi:hypothetical protein